MMDKMYNNLIHRQVPLFFSMMCRPNPSSVQLQLNTPLRSSRFKFLRRSSSSSFTISCTGIGSSNTLCSLSFIRPLCSASSSFGLGVGVGDVNGSSQIRKKPSSSMLCQDIFRQMSSSPRSNQPPLSVPLDQKDVGEPDKKKNKKSLFQTIKQMYKDYWYVLVPVHLVTSAMFLGIFYQAAKSGVDFRHYMELLGFSDKIIRAVAEGGAGNFAIAYALFKIITPIRYTVTIGSTTYCINVLKRLGYVKPAGQIIHDAAEKFEHSPAVEHMRERFGNFEESVHEKMEKYQEKHDQKPHNQSELSAKLKKEGFMKNKNETPKKT